MNYTGSIKWSDAWVFASVFGYDQNERRIDIAEIIGRGDIINHAIFTLDELKSGFKMLQVLKLIKINDGNLSLTSDAINIRARVTKKNRDLLSMVDLIIKELNSVEVLDNEIVSDVSFLTPELLDSEYKKYKNT